MWLLHDNSQNNRDSDKGRLHSSQEIQVTRIWRGDLPSCHPLFHYLFCVVLKPTCFLTLPPR